MHTEEIYLFLGLIYDLFHFLEQESATKEGILSELEDQLKGVGVEGYTGGLSGMREEVVKNMIEFVSISLIQHFELYRFVLTEEREEEVHSEEVSGNFGVNPVSGILMMEQWFPTWGPWTP